MFQRASALAGLTAGSQLLGDGMMPASIADCSTRQVRGVDAEVRLRSGLDAVRVAAAVDRVEVAVHDLGLGLALGDLDREQRLLELADVVGRRLVDVVPLDVLLRQRRAALGRAAAQVVEERAAHARDRDAAVVGEERLVLGRGDRLARRTRGASCVVDDLALLHGERAHDRAGLAVGVVREVDGRRLRAGVVGRVRDRRVRVGARRRHRRRGSRRRGSCRARRATTAASGAGRGSPVRG